MHRLSCQMSRPLACAVAGTLWSLAIVGHATPVALVAQVSAEQVTINDNRHAAGSLVGNTLTIRLEARLGEWRPDGDDGLAVKVKAFAVENGPLQVPGPLIRVHEGTQIRASIRNRLEEPLAIHGLYARPGKADDATDHLARRDARLDVSRRQPRDVLLLGGNRRKNTAGATVGPRHAAFRRAGCRSARRCTRRRSSADDCELDQRCPGRKTRPRQPIRDQRSLVAAHRAARLSGGRHRAHAPDQCWRRSAPDASARLLFQRRQPRRRS